MEIRQLTYFLAIVETGSFSAAADKLYLSQSSLSKQIQKLEKELGRALFIRSSRPVSLTEAGHALSRTAPTIVASWELFQRGLHSSTVTIAVTQVLAHYGLEALLSRFTKANPTVNIQITERDNRDIPNLLANGQADLAIFRWDADAHGRLDKLTLKVDELALLIPRDHLAADDGFVPLRTFESEKFILLGGGTQLQATIGRCMAQSGVSPVVIYEGSNTATIRSLVASGDGVAIMLHAIALNLAKEDSRLRVQRFLETESLEIVMAASKEKQRKDDVKALWDFVATDTVNT